MSAGFDPFVASFDEARLEPDPRMAFLNVKGARILQSKHSYFLSSPMEGMAVCARFGLIAPPWLAEAFLRRVDAVRKHQASSWDEAFGSPRPKGYKWPAARRRYELRTKIVPAVVEFINRAPSTPIDKANLWEPVALQVSSSATVVEEIYREAMAQGLAMAFEDLRRLTRLESGEPRIVFGAGLTPAEAIKRATCQPAQSEKRAVLRRGR